MRSKILPLGIAAADVVVSLLSACQKGTVVENLTVSEASQGDAKFLPRIYARLKWAGTGIDGTRPDPCSGSDCGNCIGFCVRVESRRITRPLTPAELADGYNYVNMSVVSGGSKVKISPEGSADNGDGKTRINSDWNVSTEAADMLGYKSIKIKAGTYTIDYSTLTYGSILMDAVVVPK